MTTLTVGQLLAAAAICDCSGKGQGRKLADALTAEAHRLHAEAGAARYIDLPLDVGAEQPNPAPHNPNAHTKPAGPNEEEA